MKEQTHSNISPSPDAPELQGCLGGRLVNCGLTAGLRGRGRQQRVVLPTALEGSSAPAWAGVLELPLLSQGSPFKSEDMVLTQSPAHPGAIWPALPAGGPGHGVVRALLLTNEGSGD